MDFYRIRQRMIKKDVLEVYPDFTVRSSFKDLMVRGKSFYAIWDEEAGLWSTNEYDVSRLVDAELQAYLDSLTDKFNCDIIVKWMGNYSTGSWRTYRKWLNDIPDSYHTLDDRLTFSNTDVVREDYVSKRLGYPLQEGSISAYDEMIGTLYDEDERRKIEWAVGSVVAGEAPSIQKFLVLYGKAGAGKSTILNIIQQLFEGYYTTFEAKALASSNNSFSTEVFKTNPLVAIQHDGDLSKIEDNTKLNSIVSHEEMTMNEKYKPSYTSRVNCFLFMATNRPVKITDAKSGIIRRLIDVKPSGNKIPPLRYRELMGRIPFELSGISWHCLKVYEQLGKDYYEAYRPVDMMFKTDVFFNFIEDSYFTFLKQDGVSLKQAYDMYKQYCNDALVEYKMPKYRFREELKNYFREFSEITRVNGKQIRNYYNGFITDQFKSVVVDDLPKPVRLELESTESIFDRECSDCPAQYATKDETPIQRWDDVTTKLSDIDTSRLHYVRVPENHIVIDFDLRGDDGEKSALRNLEEAAKWPATYAEFSKGGAGVHLHYIYDGDVSHLSRLYSYGVEIKVFNGKSSLRRRLSKCNDLPIAHISSGLPLKEGDKMINKRTVQSERGLRDLIERNLRKEIHPGTKPSVDFIKKILDDAYSSGLSYDVSDLMPKIMVFANNSTHQADYCLNLVSQMKFKSDNPAEPGSDPYSDDRIVFFDVEVFPNLFLVNWKYDGDGTACVRMINPTPQEIEQLLQMKLVGFNCRRYDNHILYARYLGYSNLELYRLSQRIVNGDRNAFFGEAYNISYTDVYDFASAGNKMSLKKWEIELGIHHQELGLPWDQPVPEDQWEKVAEYCDNDVVSTEAVFHHLSGDWAARQILAELSGLTVNDTTNQHSTKIIFQGDKHPQDKFVYTDLSKMFPGYSFDPTRKGKAKSQYKGYDVGEGGRVYAEPGMYTNVGLFDVASMHPSSIEALNLFGPYTKRFSDLKQGRIYIKHHDWEKAKHILDGALAPFIEALENGTADFTAEDLSAAVKTVINSVYGLTSASFDNPFRDPRNKDNIVAKRGALFMIDLQLECQKLGWTVVHIKTDSIKLANVTPEMEEFVVDFGKKYGYSFEHEATYDRMCIVNDAVYIAKYSDDEKVNGKHAGKWTATGTQFQIPYVFKTLFSHEPIEFRDLCETKSVTTALYLDMNEDLTIPDGVEKEAADRVKVRKKEGLAEDAVVCVNKEFSGYSDDDLRNEIAKGHNYIFIGRVGSFCPIKPGCGGGLLVREKDGKYYSATGAKGYRWLESEMVQTLHKEHDIDVRYYNSLVDDAIKDISQYCDFEWFASDDADSDSIPWCVTPEKSKVDISQCENCAENTNCDVVSK